MREGVYFQYNPRLHSFASAEWDAFYASFNMKPCKIIKMQRLGRDEGAEKLFTIEFKTPFGDQYLMAYQSELVVGVEIELREKRLQDGTVMFEKASEKVAYL